jgi:hypothetical protein
MNEWIKVVTHPLGLAGFALFLVFSTLAKVKQKDERRWLAPAAFGIAALGLAGCLLLACSQIPQPTARPSNPAAVGSVQTSYGTQSPNISGAKDVNITFGNAAPAAPGKKP